MNYRLLYLFIAAALVRFLGITQSFWLDEATTINVVRKMKGLEILTRFSPFDFHPPLYYLFMNSWTLFAGYSETAARIPSVLFSLIAGYFVFKTAVVLSNNIKTGFASAAFFLFNPLVMYYSQEARMYMMVTMFVSIFVYAFAVILKKPENKKTERYYIIANISLFLSVLTFYGVIFLPAAVYAYLAIKRQYKTLIALLPGTALGVALVSPLLGQQLELAKGALQYVKNWDLVLGIPTIKNVLLVPLKFTLGRISFDPKLVYYLLGLTGTAIVWFFLVKGAIKQKALAFVGLTTLGIAFIFSFTTPLFQYFRFLYLMPIVAVLLGFGTRVFKWERYLTLGIFIFFSVLYLTVDDFHREDWKHLLISVPASKQVFMVPSATDPVQYYYPERTVNNLFDVIKLPDTATEVYVVPYTSEIYGFDYRAQLSQKQFHLQSMESFRGVTLEYWSKQLSR